MEKRIEIENKEMVDDSESELSEDGSPSTTVEDTVNVPKYWGPLEDGNKHVKVPISELTIAPNVDEKEYVAATSPSKWITK